jgi:nicotinamidase/pyrazinamidase
MHLLIIDPQNDFMDLPASNLPVRGAQADMHRLAAMITRLGKAIEFLTITLDTHQFISIDRTTFWHDADGKYVEPFTKISAADVAAGKYAVFNPDWHERALEYLTELEARGHEHQVWPVHCVDGTWGACVYEPLMLAINEWELRTGRNSYKLRKGMNPWTEQYGAFEAVVPVNDDDTTKYNMDFLFEMSHMPGRIAVAGEASSHCVRESVYQMIRDHRGVPMIDPSRIALLTDCMSPVDGYTQRTGGFPGHRGGAWRAAGCLGRPVGVALPTPHTKGSNEAWEKYTTRSKGAT